MEKLVVYEMYCGYGSKYYRNKEDAVAEAVKYNLKELSELRCDEDYKEGGMYYGYGRTDFIDFTKSDEELAEELANSDLFVSITEDFNEYETERYIFSRVIAHEVI